MKSQNIWEPTNGPNGLDIEDVVISSTGRIVISIFGNGNYISDNNGINWIKTQSGLLDDHSYARDLVSGSNGIILAIIDNKLYRLDDNDTFWNLENDSLSSQTSLVAMQNNILYLIEYGIQSKLLYSVDTGYTLINFPFNVSYRSIYSIHINGNGNNYINVDDYGKYTIYRVNDDGSVINQVSSRLFPYTVLLWHPLGYLFGYYFNTGLIRMSADGKNPVTIANFTAVIKHMMIKSDGNLIAFTSEGDYESEDLGLHWNRKTSNISWKLQEYDRPFYFSNDFYIFNTDCGESALQKTRDSGVTWVDFDPLFTNPSYTDMFIDTHDRIFTCNCGSQAYSYSTDYGKNWHFLNTPNQLVEVSDLNSSASGKLFLILMSDLFVSENLGQNWYKSNLSDSTYFRDILGNHDSIIYVFGDPLSYVSKDGGLSWKLTTNPGYATNKILIHPDGTVFVKNSKILYSNDDGVHWTPISSFGGHVTDMKISDSGNIYFFATDFVNNKEGLFISKDKFNSFELVNDKVYYDKLLIHDEILYGSEGLNGECCDYSSDGGLNWNKFETGLPNSTICGFINKNSRNEFFIAMESDAIYKTVNSVTSISTPEEKLNSSISIYPNPVENKITITISNKNISSGHYKIIDLNGTEKLKGDFQSNVFTVDCSSLVNGMAYIQIIGKNNFNSMEKIVILH